MKFDADAKVWDILDQKTKFFEPCNFTCLRGLPDYLLYPSHYKRDKTFLFIRSPEKSIRPPIAYYKHS